MRHSKMEEELLFGDRVWLYVAWAGLELIIMLQLLK